MKNFIKVSTISAIMVVVAMLVTMTSCEKDDEIVREDLIQNKAGLQLILNFV